LRTQSRAGEGQTYKQLYEQKGVFMCPHSARFAKGSGHYEGGNGAGVEPGIAFLLNYMLEGRFKASQMLQKFWEEFRTYHRIDGKINKKHDHVLDAIRYAMMMLRYARPYEQQNFPTRVAGVYDPLNPHRSFQPHRGLPQRVN
jgi:hypothetical protein